MKRVRPKFRFVQVSSFQLLKLKQLHCDDLHIILSLSAVQIDDYFIYSYTNETLVTSFKVATFLDGIETIDHKNVFTCLLSIV